ncbi:LysR family transcriptional regulator [Nonomuraea sp. MCN248]|uniref:LysR family transcriptional regulator n=1 Tax=Nonomuraea corallina TaxID=2989783 RepID=A0ABT4SLM3_9ACTN|nr:LysR family transcriptional regulator [Nonomuraea corallina]MDA0637890.1 LysR family transcriptional regulator [Nonomuraea corallina]
MIDPWTLQVTAEVAERGSFSAAAEALSMTQPAVSRQVSGLERRLRVSLFRRTSRGVRPTAAGEIVVQQAKDILARLRDLELRLGAFTDMETGDLRMSAFSSANTFFTPEVVRRFDLAHPGVTLSLMRDDPTGPLTALKEGKVDLALITAWSLYADPAEAKHDPAATPLDPDALTALDLAPLLDEEFEVALPADHPLARHRRVRLSDLHGERWVEGGHPDCLGPIPQLAKALGAAPRTAFFCEDWNGKQALVAGGSAIMLVPTLARRAVRPDVALRPTVPALPARRLYAASMAPPFRLPSVTALLAVLADVAREQAPVT